MKQRPSGLEPFNVEEEQRIIRDCVKAANNIETMTDRATGFYTRQTALSPTITSSVSWIITVNREVLKKIF
jgi:hypothetical protein